MRWGDISTKKLTLLRACYFFLEPFFSVNAEIFAITLYNRNLGNHMSLCRANINVGVGVRKLNPIGVAQRTRQALRVDVTLIMIAQSQGEKIGTTPGSVENTKRSGPVMNAGDQRPLAMLNVCECGFKKEVVQ